MPYLSRHDRRPRAGADPISHALAGASTASRCSRNWARACAGTAVFRQRGISLVWTTVLSALLALVAMGALFSARYDRNLFAEAWHKVAGGDMAQQAMDAASKATGAAPVQVVLRKCLIDGKLVVSNVDCKADNKTSKALDLHDSHGFGPVAAPAAHVTDEPTSNPELDKAIDKQLR